MTELIKDGSVLVATNKTDIAGYVAYSRIRDYAKVVHLCIASAQRGNGVARLLVEELFIETEDCADVRLYCRADYALNDFWPRLGFVCVGERPGRSREATPLFLWVRRNVAKPLLAAVDAQLREGRLTAVLDANVFFDLSDDSARSQESKALFADWLADEVAFCLTPEILNEVARNQDPQVRDARRLRATEFIVLEPPTSEASESLSTICRLLPAPGSASDASDRRQLAHAIAAKADYFVTRDEALLQYSSLIWAECKLQTIRPVDLILAVHSQTNDNYAPARLAGTRVTCEYVAAEAQLLPFQRHHTGETRAEWLRQIRPALSDPGHYFTKVICVEGDARVAYSTESTKSGVAIRYIRAIRGPLAATLMRRALAEVVEACATRSDGDGTWIHCVDSLDPGLTAALVDIGFTRSSVGYSKLVLRGIRELGDVQRLASPFCAIRPEEAERVCWPCKVLSKETATYVVPIRPYWAASLFDRDLAERELFGVKEDVALALENVYYSMSAIDIPEGSRILWYVSDPVQAVRGVSISLGSVRACARDLFRKFSRLGTYTWADLVRHAGDPWRPMVAYRFAFTERLPLAVSWSRFQRFLRARMGRTNPLAGPVRISDEVFADVYRAASDS
ncbi:MAG: GNAT family N-acetyltransferase [Myxococcales bacterium]|nr:GNAT family N-acetyltransferase [Myxococcales bacterium]